MAWSLKRLFLSAVVATHLAAVVLCNLPDCAIKQRCGGWIAYYLLPLGLDQGWGMFAPDPGRVTVALEAIAVDDKGRTYTFSFPRVADLSPWQGIPKFRHSKYQNEINHKTRAAQREFAARHVVRRLGLKEADFPVLVQLYFQVRMSPPPGGPPADPMAEPTREIIDTFRFPSLQEALP
ncbi:MAG: hypothetical protein IRY99_10595 [Isosphaeraceae bacterium]|nr:hypothetical protein [Isosphaeraceae bacterium]